MFIVHDHTDDAESHKRLKNHNTLRTRTGIERILKHSITEMCLHGTFRGDAEIEYSNQSVYSVFLKTLAHCKLADIVTIPEILGLILPYQKSQLSLLVFKTMYLLKSLIVSLTPTLLNIPSLGYLGDFIRKL